MKEMLGIQVVVGGFAAQMVYSAHDGGGVDVANCTHSPWPWPIRRGWRAPKAVAGAALAWRKIREIGAEHGVPSRGAALACACVATSPRDGLPATLTAVAEVLAHLSSWPTSARSAGPTGTAERSAGAPELVPGRCKWRLDPDPAGTSSAASIDPLAALVPVLMILAMMVLPLPAFVLDAVHLQYRHLGDGPAGRRQHQRTLDFRCSRRSSWSPRFLPSPSTSPRPASSCSRGIPAPDAAGKVIEAFGYTSWWAATSPSVSPSFSFWWSSASWSSPGRRAGG